MNTRREGAVEQQVERSELLDELHAWQKQLPLPSLDEAIRFIESNKVEKLTEHHIRRIAGYDAITIEGESFFDKAFTSGKEVAACLGYAMQIGWGEVLNDMIRLRLSVRGRRHKNAAQRPTGSAALEAELHPFGI